MAWYSCSLTSMRCCQQSISSVVFRRLPGYRLPFSGLASATYRRSFSSSWPVSFRLLLRRCPPWPASLPSIFGSRAITGFNGLDFLTKVILPAIAPQVITSLRVTAGLAWLVVVAAEMIAGRDGLGFAIWDARNGLRMDLLVAGMIVIGVIGMVIDRVL